MIQVFIKDGESDEKFLRRFAGHIKSRRLMQKLRRGRYFKQTPRKREVREAAVMREHHRAVAKKRQYLS